MSDLRVISLATNLWANQELPKPIITYCDESSFLHSLVYLLKKNVLINAYVMRLIILIVENANFRCQARARYNTTESMRNIFVTYPYHNHGIDE